jgi:putative ABC transport system permease protein
MALIAVRMMFHAKLKMAGTLAGVVFAVVLANQQVGTFFGLLHKNTMFLDHAAADVWIVPPSTPQLQFGNPLPESVLLRAKVAPGVAWAEPLLFGGATIKRTDGGSQPVTLVGTRDARKVGVPWNVVAGDVDQLRMPDTVFFESAEREKFGGLNLGSVRELNGKKVRVGGFTWGLLPFGPSYAFADYELARQILQVDPDQQHFVLVKAAEGSSAEEVARDLQSQIPEARVMTTAAFKASTVQYVLTATAIGVTLGSSALFGLIVGFTVVALMMFSAVLDNLREFGTLKAVGATTWDLSKLLLVQAVLYASIGTLIGLALVGRLAEAIRSPQLALVLPPELFAITGVVMTALCILASLASIVRLHKLEPAMVFR